MLTEMPLPGNAADDLAVLHTDLEPTAMTRPLSSLIRKEPVSCPPETPVRTVIETMHGRRIGSMIVCDHDGTPLGIFTMQDILDRVTLPAIHLATPIGELMSGPLQTLPPHAT